MSDTASLRCCRSRAAFFPTKQRSNMAKRYRCTLYSFWYRPEVHDGFESEKEAEAFGKNAKNERQYQYEVEEYNEKENQNG